MAYVKMYPSNILRAVRRGTHGILVAKLNTAAVVAAATAPRDSGDFASSFEVRIGDFAGWVVSTDPAASYIEFGTSDTPAHRTLGRATDAMRE